MAKPPGQADPRSVATLVRWRKKPWSLCVLRYAEGIVTLYDQDDASLFSVDAAHVGVRPMSGQRFALEVGGRTYVVIAVDLRGSGRPKARRLAERYHTLLVPLPEPDTPNWYRTWLDRSVSAASNAVAHHALWQQYWLRLLAEAGATRRPSRLWTRMDGRPGEPVRLTPAHGRATTVLIIVWILIPLLSLGYLTWLTYLYAAIRVRRSMWLWLCALLAVVLDGVYYWLGALVGSGRADAVGGLYAGMMAMLSLCGSLYAWLLHLYVFDRV